METSQNIVEISKAMAKAIEEINPVIKNDANDYFKKKDGSDYRFANLSAHIDAIADPLKNNGLLLIQMPTKKGLSVRIVHTESGEYFQDTAEVDSVPADPQKYYSMITYLRRCTISAMFRMKAVDDDGNAAARPPKTEATKVKAPTRADMQKAITACEGVGVDFDDTSKNIYLNAVGADATKKLQELRDSYTRASQTRAGLK